MAWSDDKKRETVTPHGGKGNASEHGTVAKLALGSNPSQGRSRCAVDENTNEEKLAAEIACTFYIPPSRQDRYFIC